MGDEVQADLREVKVETAADPGVTENPPAETPDVPDVEVMVGELDHPEPVNVERGVTGNNEGFPAQIGAAPDTTPADTPDEPRRVRKAK